MIRTATTCDIVITISPRAVIRDLPWSLPEPSANESNKKRLEFELLCRARFRLGEAQYEYEAAYQRPRISNFIELPGGRPKRRKGSRNGSHRCKSTQGSSKRLRRFYGVLEKQSRNKQQESHALYRAYEEEAQSMEAEIRQQERLAAKKTASKRRTARSGILIVEPLKSLSSRLGFESQEGLKAHVRAVLLAQR